VPEHTCHRNRSCTCSIQGLEPDDDCPIHSDGEFPPRCCVCGRLLPWPGHSPVVRTRQTRLMDLLEIRGIPGRVFYRPGGQLGWFHTLPRPGDVPQRIGYNYRQAAESIRNGMLDFYRES
jgi:hypothetical protein